MTASPPNSSSEDRTLPLLLFALTTKLWIDRLHNIHHRHNDGTNDTTNNSVPQSSSGNPLETDEERRIRRNLRLSIDSPEFSKHHFNTDNGNESPLRRRSRRTTGSLPDIRSEDDHDDDDNDNGEEIGSSMTFLHAECPRWRKLMERVSFADSVLTRVS